MRGSRRPATTGRRRKMRYMLEDYAHDISRAHPDDAGIDMRTPYGFTLHAGEQKVIDLGVRVQLPLGTFGKMESKSGLMVNHGIICMGGVIDAGFRGTIKVRMWNTSSEDYTFEEGDKLVQMVPMKVDLDDLEESSVLDEAHFGRGESGWGSTGR